jgi:hypothetical protein
VFCANALETLLGYHGENVAERIRAQLIYFACFGSGCFNDAANATEKSNRVRQSTHHHCRERFGNIQWNISSFLNYALNI